MAKDKQGVGGRHCHLVTIKFANNELWNHKLKKQNLMNVLNNLQFDMVSQANNYYRFSKRFQIGKSKTICSLIFQPKLLILNSNHRLTDEEINLLLNDLIKIKLSLIDFSWTISGSCQPLVKALA